jgi:hypothetical protein
MPTLYTLLREAPRGAAFICCARIGLQLSTVTRWMLEHSLPACASPKWRISATVFTSIRTR